MQAIKTTLAIKGARILVACPDAAFASPGSFVFAAPHELQLWCENLDFRKPFSATGFARFDIVLLDRDLILDQEREFFCTLRAEPPVAKVILISVVWTTAAIDFALSFGVKGFLTRDCTPRQCLDAIRMVLAGEIWAPRSALSFAYENLLRKSRYALWDGLTKRQSEIARLASDGMTNKEIAKRLAISHTTVKKHLQQIYQKLHVARRGKLGTVTT